MQSANLLLSPPPPLLAQLKREADELLSRIVRANYNTQFAQAASELTEFRRATANLVNGIDNDFLSDLFRKNISLTTYDAYAPFIAKFFEKPCKENSIVDMLAPGLPDYLIYSSSTSGGLQKFFPKYDPNSTLASANAGSRGEANRRHTKLFLISFRINEMDVEDEENRPVKRIYTCPMSTLRRRIALNMNPIHDEERMATSVPLDHVAPYAAAFINKWRSFLLIHALFAAASKSLETIQMGFISVFVDMMRHLDTEFDMVVDCIENGTIPSVGGVEELRHYLEPSLLPDPERAAELRSLGRPSLRPGWCGHAWPNLRFVRGISSGSFASYVPLAQWYLGPNSDIRSGNYGSTEVSIGTAYDPRELNLYKLIKTSIIEFLDIEKGDNSINSFSQSWEVEVGKRYEIVATNSDGLWRYRLGDVIEIAGFDPTDGMPVMKFIERRNVIMVILPTQFTEKELRAAISSTSLVNVVDWTATIDDRQLPKTIGFFVELASDEVSDLALTAPDQALDTLIQLQPRISHRFEADYFRKPTIRLVRRGTFSDFRQLKLDEGNGGSLGQIKVPVVLPKAEYVTWFSNRVVREL